MSGRRGATANGEGSRWETSYESIMGSAIGTTNADTTNATAIPGNTDETAAAEAATKALSSRLVTFRQWLTDEARVDVHPALCIVNGEATDGTRNAPVLVFEKHPTVTARHKGRVGTVDQDGDRLLWDRTMGCQVRAAREIKPEEVLMTMPRSAMISPDLVAASDAGKAVLACVSHTTGAEGFWDVFENTTLCEATFSPKVAGNTGPQLLVKILQERKKVEALFNHRKNSPATATIGAAYSLAASKGVSTRAPVLAFLIHQRFSNTSRPAVSSDVHKLQMALENSDGNALRPATSVRVPSGAPETFAPYARTLPSSVSIPLCWKRNELALLAGCIPGVSLLQEVATSTLQLAAEFAALLEAGILERFPETFPPGLLTWERWIWAAACSSSRVLPATSYLNEGDTSASTFVPTTGQELQSPPDIWNELGVMIPLLDMLNHETEAHQVTWKPCVPESNVKVEDSPGPASHPPEAIVHKRVRKGSEVYCCYGLLSNQDLILRYGFAQMNNPSDEIKIGWTLSDAVGRVKTPTDYTPLLSVDDQVYESSDSDAINTWWTQERLNLLEKEAFRGSKDSFAALQAGKKLSFVAYGDGTYHPILLTMAVVATMPPRDVREHLQEEDEKISLSIRHQRILRNYLAFTFTRKLEKLLNVLANGLHAHFNNVKLWTKATDGGLRYKSPEDTNGDYVGWQTFFDSHAYGSSMEVEKKYYAMGSDSCVLTLYDGQLRALQISIEGAVDEEKFQESVLKQICDLGFALGKDDVSDSTKEEETNGKTSKRSRKNRKRGSVNSVTSQKQPAVKLHIGNLAYSTTPSDLYDHFSTRYGKDNILECHIPIERDTGRSRGFGFVTLPESIANEALQSREQHEIDGRLVKVAKSSSAGSNNSGKSITPANAHLSTDRCAKCGYRPKYCVCREPSLPGIDRPPTSIGGGGRGPPTNNGHEPGQYGGADRYRDDRYHREPSPYRHDRGYPDRYGRGRPYDEFRDRSHHRIDDYDRDIDRHRGSRRRDRSVSPGSRSSGRRRAYEEGRSHRRDEESDWESGRKRTWSRERSRDRDRSRSRDRSRRKKSKRRRSRSRSRSFSPGAVAK
jgi:RNA recognition motif-containing protein